MHRPYGNLLKVKSFNMLLRSVKINDIQQNTHNVLFDKYFLNGVIGLLVS